jgi:hypothetical protein
MAIGKAEEQSRRAKQQKMKMDHKARVGRNPHCAICLKSRKNPFHTLHQARKASTAKKQLALIKDRESLLTCSRAHFYVVYLALF